MKIWQRRQCVTPRRATVETLPPTFEPLDGDGLRWERLAVGAGSDEPRPVHHPELALPQLIRQQHDTAIKQEHHTTLTPVSLTQQSGFLDTRVNHALEFCLELKFSL